MVRDGLYGQAVSTKKKAFGTGLGMALEDRRSSLFQHGSKGVSEATS